MISFPCDAVEMRSRKRNESATPLLPSKTFTSARGWTAFSSKRDWTSSLLVIGIVLESSGKSEISPLFAESLAMAYWYEEVSSTAPWVYKPADGFPLSICFRLCGTIDQSNKQAQFEFQKT